MISQGRLDTHLHHLAVFAQDHSSLRLDVQEVGFARDLHNGYVTSNMTASVS